MEYRLDLDTLLLMLGQSTGSLYSEFQHIAGVKGRCQVFLRLEQGTVKSCTVTNERGSEVAYGDAAIKLIQNQVLDWHYVESQGSPVQRHDTPRSLPQTMPLRMAQTGPLRERLTGPLRAPLMPALRSPVPHRTYPVSQDEFMLWPRLYRSVYSLIDGKVSVEYIVRLLAREQGIEKVREVLLYLQRAGLIRFD